MKNSLKILLGIITSIIFIKLFLTQFYQNTLFINGSIITMDNKDYVAEAVLVNDGKIEKIGTTSDLIQFNDWKTNVIDLKGKTLMPGLIEAHCHPIITSILSQIFDLSHYNFSSRRETIDAIKNEVPRSG